MDKDKIIAEQQKEIESLKRKIEILQVNNDLLEKEMNGDIVPNQDINSFIKKMYQIVDDTRQEYEDLIVSLKEKQSEYQTQIQKVYELKKNYIQEIEKVKEENTKL